MGKDFYQILQVQPQATAAEIRSAYRQRALELHPDVSGADSESFLELQEAYSILVDPATRAAYDREVVSVSVKVTHIPIRRAATSPSGRAEKLRQSGPTEFFDPFETSFDLLFERLWRSF